MDIIVICAFRAIQVRSLILQTISLPWICFWGLFTPVMSFLQFLADIVLEMITLVPSGWTLTDRSCWVWWGVQKTFLNTQHLFRWEGRDVHPSLEDVHPQVGESVSLWVSEKPNVGLLLPLFEYCIKATIFSVVIIWATGSICYLIKNKWI